jgi:chaperone modulatory protein CbpM
MLVSSEKVAGEIEMDAAELAAWIKQGWVLPVEEKGRFLFDEADVARVRLIAELRRDLGVNDEAVPVVLRLLDQVYALRKALGDLNGAIQALPADFRARLKAELKKASENSQPPPE